MRIAIYPGTFDPVTNGHIHIAERASRLFDRVIIAVALDNYKTTLFTLEERKKMMRDSTRHIANVEVQSFSGLVVEYARAKDAKALIRGLRAITDFEYEMQYAAMNKHLDEKLETVFLMTADKYAFLSSSVVKQIAVLGGSIKGLVPDNIEKCLQEKYRDTKS